MVVLSRYFIKSSLIFLVLALLAGLLLAADRLWNLPAYFSALSPVYFHLFLVGWITQLIFGVVYWMFPKASLEKPRGSEELAWATFWLLNVGLVLRVIAEPLAALVPPHSVWGWLLAASAMLQWAAGLLFVANTWGRVKEK
jgi:cbb3-type cytochrome oxidase subunit 1